MARPCLRRSEHHPARTGDELISQRGEVVASTVLEQAPCTRADCIGSKMKPR
jgi:hypothetical protein